MAPPLLGLPHHDGSSLYVSSLTPSLGDEVVVRLRVPQGSRAGAVWVRVVEDAEPVFVEATVDRTTATETWWYARITVRNMVTRYRWLLSEPYRWVTQAGVLRTDPTDAADFRLVAHDAPPGWVRDAVVYQIFPDRFARSAGADAWQQFPSWSQRAVWTDPVHVAMPGAMTQLYGGDLDGVVDHLDHLRSLGVNTIYTTPFFPGGSNHRYDASSFGHVDPVLGGDAAFARMTDALHRAGIRVIGDLTTNHSGATHEWFRAAQADAASDEATFYTFKDHPDDYEAWFGIRSLPKLNHDARALDERLISGPDAVVSRFLRPPFSMDGWRIDVANMTGRLRGQDVNHDVARRLRAAIARTNADAMLIAEHCHDASDDLDGDGWYSTMNYSGFTNPIWSWLGAPSDRGFFGSPLPLQRRGGADVRATIDAFAAAISWRSRTANLNLLDSHDSIRFLSAVGGSDALQHAGATLLLTFPGVPSIFQGDELGLTGDHSHLTRAPMPWAAPATWNHTTLQHYRDTIAARHASDALRGGGFRWASIGDDHLAYVRETDAESVLVTVNRGPDATVGAALDASLTAMGIDTGAALHDLARQGSTTAADIAERAASGPSTSVVLLGSR